MNIIIPLGGIGKRFSDNGYTKPKPLIKVLGKEIIFWLLDSLNIDDSDN
jgi:NDP-sugar pyrophosphorylase family protein